MFVADSDYVIRMRRLFHQHPELGFLEFETARNIQSELDAISVPYSKSIGGTGIVVQFGTGHPHIAFRAEMDALPITEVNDDIDYASTKPGRMHACGHDAHIAVLLHTLRQIKVLSDSGALSGKVSFIFQPCEETHNERGESGAQIVLNEALLQDVDHFFGGHVESTFESGKVFIRDNALTAAIDRFDIDIIGEAGHGAYPHKAVDPIWIASQVVSAIHTLQSRCIDTNSPSVITVGSIAGGDVWNAIPGVVSLSGTIRTFDERVRVDIHKLLERCLNVSEALGGRHTLKISRGNPTIINDVAVSNVLRDCAASVVGRANVLDVDLQMGGDDFSRYSIYRPSSFFYFGAKRDSFSRQHHSGNFNIDESVLVKFSNILYTIAEHYVVKI